MKDLVGIINVFALLSLLAVGGGTAVLPQMKHDTVDTHHWVTDEQFTTIYSLGQLAPGPNMTMVSLIGYHAGLEGGGGIVIAALAALAALVAFFFPSSLLCYGASHIWDSFRGSPWRDAVQRGMAPVTIGLMLAGVYAVGKTASISLDRPLTQNLITLGIGAAVVLILFARRINPAILILLGGVLGYFLLEARTV